MLKRTCCCTAVTFFALLFSVAVFGDLQPLCAQQQIDFNRQIKPIFSDNCYACHGPDEAQRQTEFRVDLKEAAFADLGGYAAIVPNDVDSSEIVKRVLSDDPDFVMPSVGSPQKTDGSAKTINRRLDQTRCRMVRSLGFCRSPENGISASQRRPVACQLYRQLHLVSVGTTKYSNPQPLPIFIPCSDV